jgi:hypothetical protein
MWETQAFAPRGVRVDAVLLEHRGAVLHRFADCLPLPARLGELRHHLIDVLDCDRVDALPAADRDHTIERDPVRDARSLGDVDAGGGQRRLLTATSRLAAYTSAPDGGEVFDSPASIATTVSPTPPGVTARVTNLRIWPPRFPAGRGF